MSSSADLYLGGYLTNVKSVFFRDRVVLELKISVLFTENGMFLTAQIYAFLRVFQYVNGILTAEFMISRVSFCVRKFLHTRY